MPGDHVIKMPKGELLNRAVIVSEEEVTVYKAKREDGIIGMMDCGGSNLVKINEQIPDSVRLLVTSKIDHPDCKAREKQRIFNVPLVDVDFEKYEAKRGVQRGDYLNAVQGRHDKIKGDLSPERIIQVRTHACNYLLNKMYAVMDKEGIPRHTPAFAAGFMSLLSEEFVKAIDIKNVHPGALTKYHVAGLFRGEEKLVVGDGWKPSAIALSAGHDNLHSSIHIMTPKMDAGPVHMRGYPLPIDYNYLLAKIDPNNRKAWKTVAGIAQDILKEIGDHVIAGATFSDTFDDKWGMHKSGCLAYNFQGRWYLVPNGISAEDHARNNPNSPFRRDKKFLETKVNEFYDRVEKEAA